MKPTHLPKSVISVLMLFTLGSGVQAQIVPAGLVQKLVAVAPQSIQEKLLLQQQAANYFAAILKVPPGKIVENKSIPSRSVVDLSELGTTPQEQVALAKWAVMVEEKTLRENLVKLIDEVKKSPTAVGKQIQGLPPEKLEYATTLLQSSVEALVKMRGLTKDSKHNSYTEWTDLSKKMLAQVDQTPKGLENVLALSGSTWIKTESIESLVDGPASFAKRDKLMNEAQESIHILTWSIYDDVTGKQLVDLLLKKRSENRKIKIRVIVDGQVANGATQSAQVQRLESEGIEVVRWFSADNSYMGQHRKMLIVDDKHMVAGGLNFGDVYSHKNPDLKIPRWRDTDIYLGGQAARAGQNLFAQLWNQQLKEQKQLSYRKMDQIQVEPLNQGREISIINHDPQTAKAGSTIMLTLLKGIREAQSQIDIENAYIILFPALRSEIQAALKRGVKVRIFTNSAQSVDEPAVSIPILRSVADFVDMGAEVFVKKGATLHSKLVMIDSVLTFVMSYNLHPRSERIEGEMTIVVRDEAFAKSMHNVFDNDTTDAKATLVKNSADLVIPNSPVSVPTLRLFFDML